MAKKKFSNNRDRFIYLATYRTNILLKRIKILSNCSNKNLYEYKQEDIDKIFEAVEKKLEEAKLKFKEKGQDEFNL